MSFTYMIGCMRVHPNSQTSPVHFIRLTREILQLIDLCKSTFRTLAIQNGTSSNNRPHLTLWLQSTLAKTRKTPDLKISETRWNPLKPGENPLKPSENRWKRFWHPKPKSLRDFPCAKKQPILKSVKSTRWLENDTHCPSWLHQLHPEYDKNRLLIWHFRKFRPLLFKSSPKMWKTLRRVAENGSRKQDRSPRIQMATIGQELTLIRRQSRHRPRVFLQHGLS